MDPALAVVCSSCKAPIGVNCRHPSGSSGPFVELHAARDIVADREGKYRFCPLGLCGLDREASQFDLPLFD